MIGFRVKYEEGSVLTERWQLSFELSWQSMYLQNDDTIRIALELVT